MCAGAGAADKTTRPDRPGSGCSMREEEGVANGSFKQRRLMICHQPPATKQGQAENHVGQIRAAATAVRPTQYARAPAICIRLVAMAFSTALRLAPWMLPDTSRRGPVTGVKGTATCSLG